nr:phage portal protein [Companilactobacillus paralimentarius]
MGSIKNAEMIENINPIYTPNMPKNNTEIMQTVTALVNTGKVSDQTIREQIEPITGVSNDAEQQRIDEQDEMIRITIRLITYFLESLMNLKMIMVITRQF